MTDSIQQVPNFFVTVLSVFLREEKFSYVWFG